MKLSLTHKFFFTLLAALCLVVMGMYFLIQYSFDRGFLHYVNTMETKRFESLAATVQTTYGEHGNWDFLRSNYQLWRELMEGSQPENPRQVNPRPMDRMVMGREPMPGHQRPDGPPRPPDRFRSSTPHRPPPGEGLELSGSFAHRIVLTDELGNILFGPPDQATMNTIALKQGSEMIGSLGLVPQQRLMDELQLHFAAQQKRTFGIIALAMACLAALLSLPLAKQMVKRIKALASATHQLTAGQYDTRLQGGGTDELGQLSQDFNMLAYTLEHNEQARQQWVGDISHELRTPLAVLRGEIEAIQDNIRPATPQAFDSLYAEVMRLKRLVDDLFQLSMSDIGALTYRKKDLNLIVLLDNGVESFCHAFMDKNISISKNWPANQPVILFGDPDRLAQLFDNLLSNSIKYTDPDGEVDLKLSLKNKTATILLQDSAPGVSSAEIKKLFDRLYRVENSRNSALGGAGLGLAICKNIVEAHGGIITAQPSRLGGVLIRIELPLAGDKNR